MIDRIITFIDWWGDKFDSLDDMGKTWMAFFTFLSVAFIIVTVIAIPIMIFGPAAAAVEIGMMGLIMLYVVCWITVRDR